MKLAWLGNDYPKEARWFRQDPFSSSPDARSFSPYYQLPRSIFAEEREETFPRSLGS